MEIMQGKEMPLSMEELENITGGMSADVLDMKTMRIKVKPGESAAAELNNTLNAGISFMGMKVAVSDEKGLLMNAAVRLDENMAAERSCLVRFRMIGYTRAVITGVEI